MLFKDCGRTDRWTTTDGEWSQKLTLSLRLRWAKNRSYMNPYECQRSRSFSDLGSRSLGLNVHQNFKYILLRNQRAISSQILYRTFMPHRNKSLYNWSWSHDKDGSHTHIGQKSLWIFFSRTIIQMTLKLNSQHKRLEPYKSYINDDPGLTLTYLMARSNLFP